LVLEQLLLSANHNKIILQLRPLDPREDLDQLPMLPAPLDLVEELEVDYSVQSLPLQVLVLHHLEQGQQQVDLELVVVSEVPQIPLLKEDLDHVLSIDYLFSDYSGP
jgi:hypothetical protein